MLRELVFTEFISALRPGIQVGLVGGLGAGKTTFTARVLKHLGVVESVTSPSFSLCHEYKVQLHLIGSELSDGSTADLLNSSFKSCKFEHWDLYRLNTIPDEMLYTNNDSEPSVIRFIEWSDKFPDLDTGLDIKLFFEVWEGEDGGIERRILW
jgi:tRNA A37 threonylcarbamoyladenosine biosynthesis protein TsaE